MTSAWMFYAMALILALGVWGVLYAALRAGRRRSSIEEPWLRANAAVYQDQLRELERDLQSGVLSPSDHQSAREDLESRLLQDVDGLTAEAPTRPEQAAPAPTAGQVTWFKTTSWGLAIALPLLSLGVYQWLGQPQALEPQTLAQGMPSEHLTPERLEGMAKALRERLQQNPDQAEDWVMLARVERALDHYDAAAQALASALKLSQDLDWAIERAEILATARQGDFQGEPWQIITSVLKTDPQHLGALLLAGSASYSEGRYPQALKHWEQASALVPADAPDRQPLDAALSQVRSKLGLPDPRAQAMAASAVRGRVSLAPSALERVQANDTVFIYATAPDSRMPLAIEQIKAAQLPYDFVLDDSKAMNPQVHLSDATVLVVRARVSRSGQAQAQPQDLSAELTGVRPGTKGLQLILK